MLRQVLKMGRESKEWRSCGREFQRWGEAERLRARAPIENRKAGGEDRMWAEDDLNEREGL